MYKSFLQMLNNLFIYNDKIYNNLKNTFHFH